MKKKPSLLVLGALVCGSVFAADADLTDLQTFAPESKEYKLVYKADLLKGTDAQGNPVYVTDNCGEVVCDRLVIEELSRRFPSLSVTVLVRGQDALNDATREDAAQVGLDSVADIADNGCGVAGTPLEYVGEAARGLLEGADVILSKGQGNFETMHGCGLNVYYSFLCKCDWFQKRFGMEKNRGVFITERDAALL